VARLGDVADALKSANAGATWITFDIVFGDRQRYDAVRRSGVVDRELFANLYRVAAAEVRIYECDQVLTIKATIPRRAACGGPDETDFDGVQQFAPLLDVEVPGI
jgi:hypothetical protein